MLSLVVIVYVFLVDIFFFLVSLGSNENIDKNMFGSMKDFKSNNIEKL